MSMIRRFSLYGFLRNQKYYEPFLVLALTEKGLSFFLIGILIAFNKAWMNILEVPSGLAADLFGRRKAMAASLAAYIVSFLIFAWSASIGLLFSAMFFHAVGEAFRTGTHKAMIFDWLAGEGRSDEKTAIYGYTRSWSQAGAAVSVLIAAAAVAWSGNYRLIFLLSTLPYAVNILNLLSYPARLDGPGSRGAGNAGPLKKNPGRLPGDLVRNLRDVLVQTLKNRKLRNILIESAVLKGNATLARDYLQPMVRQLALGLPLLLAWKQTSREAVLMGLLFFLLHALSSLASRKAGAFVKRLGGSGTAARHLRRVTTVLFVPGTLGLYFDLEIAAVSALILVVVIQNLWRPILMERIDEAGDASMGAAIFSVDSQGASLYLLIAAPLTGLAADHLGLWAVAAAAGVSCGIFALPSPAQSGKQI